MDYTVHGVTKSRTRLSDFHCRSLFQTFSDIGHCAFLPQRSVICSHVYEAWVCARHWMSCWNAKVEKPWASLGPCALRSIPSLSSVGVGWGRG